jgi:TIGR03009 family protein
MAVRTDRLGAFEEPKIDVGSVGGLLLQSALPPEPNGRKDARRNAVGLAYDIRCAVDGLWAAGDNAIQGGRLDMQGRHVCLAGLLTAACAILIVASAKGQTGPQPSQYAPAAQPTQPVNPQLPAIERRYPPAAYPSNPSATPPSPYAPPAAREAAPAWLPAAGPVAPPAGPSPRPIAQAPSAPFDLSPQEVAEVDRVLKLWEQRSAGVRTFQCGFKRWKYDPIFGPQGAPQFEDIGLIKYSAPDRGVFQLTKTVKDGAEHAIDPERVEHWICDGKSIFEILPKQRTVKEYPLPIELQGKAITNGPLPFLFGAKADDLKQRYFMRLVTPAHVQSQQTWIEAYPRNQANAASFSRAILVLTNHNMQPFGIKLFETNGKNETSYQFFDIVVNDPLRFFKGDPFHASVPFGWQKVVEQPPASQAARMPSAPNR